MNRFEMLQQLAAHARTSEFDALYIVSWMSADMDNEGLERLLKAVHKDARDGRFQAYLSIVEERYGRRPGDTR